MSGLPSKPVLSLPAYLDSIQSTLDSHDPHLWSRFEKVLTKYAADVFPDQPQLKLWPKLPEDKHIEEPW